jgi:hypothetical protein
MWSDLRALGEGAPVAPTRHNVSISIGPPVLVFGGSGGGLMTSAALLAARGYPSLALAYFKAPGLPQTLHNIPLEYFAKAEYPARWSTRRPGPTPADRPGRWGAGPSRP